MPERILIVETQNQRCWVTCFFDDPKLGLMIAVMFSDPLRKVTHREIVIINS